MAATQRIAAGTVVAAVCAASLAGCAIGGTGARQGAPGRRRRSRPRRRKSVVRLIGDGSTAFTGAQPHLPRPERLKPGQKPPQFVVFSWDGAGEDSQRLFSHFRKVAKENNATMTYFLSGVYMLPEEKRDLYRPPQHSPGRSDIGFNDDKGIARHREAAARRVARGQRDRHPLQRPLLRQRRRRRRVVGRGVEERDRPGQAVREDLEDQHRPDEGAAPLPFDYDKELIGARTPCLEGQKNFMRRPASWASATTPAASTTSSGRKKKRGPVGPVHAAGAGPRATPSSADHGLQLHGQPVGHQDPGRPRQARLLGRPDARRPAQGLLTGPTTATARP